MISNLEAKTGRSFDEWLAVARATGHVKHAALVSALKSDHALTHGYANLVAHRALATDAGSHADDDLIDAQYTGAKAGLRPIYDELIGAITDFGPDVEIAPKKAYVSLRRRKQFAIIQPSTATRVDVGLNLAGEATGPRLEASGSFNQMVSHRVRVGTVDDVDADLIAWLRRAYDGA
jgi:hypothetical protein